MELKKGSCMDEESNSNNTHNVTNTKNPSNKAVNGRRRFGENGFEEGGGYMNVKKAKLHDQYNVSSRGLGSEDSSEIFKGLSIYINGYTNPPEPELRELFILHGGTFHPYQSSRTTYVIATNLSTSSKQRYGCKTITPDWIMDSIAASAALDTRNYMLYNFNQEKNQMTLTQIMSSKKGHRTSNTTSTNGTIFHGEETTRKYNTTATSNDIDINSDNEKQRVSESDEEFYECSQEIFSSPGGKKSSIGNQVNGISNGDSNQVTSTINQENIDNSSSNKSAYAGCSTPEKNPNLPNNSNISPTNGKPERIKSANDDGFLEDFFGRSRLHLISEQKKDMQILVMNLRKNIESHIFHNLQKYESEIENTDSINGLSSSIGNQVTLMHVDMDCFFVSVGLLNRPHLRGKPVVVTHSSGKVQESKSDIACASYEARKFGIRNGMWVGDAKSLCSNLEVIPYDFEEYRKISKQFFNIVASVTLDIETCSVDEMLIDATPILKKVPGSTPENLAAFLREAIRHETGCPASVGIGSNRLLAKLAVKLAKPDGIYNLQDDDAPTYIQSLKVRDLPGVGWSNEEKLRDFNVETCGDLLKVPIKNLRSYFGEKTAEKMQNLCKGIDISEIKVGMDKPKSISVDVNFGIRFTKDDEVFQFLMKLCKELSSRAEKIEALSSHFTLKLLIRKKGAGDPLKPGGHGIVDSMTRSRTLLNPTRNWHEFFKLASSLVRLMRVPATEYRGVGLIISDLTFNCDKINKKSVQRTLTDMPISRAQKMLSISQKKKKQFLSDNTSNKVDSTESASDNFIDSTETSPKIIDNSNNILSVPDTGSTRNHIAATKFGSNNGSYNLTKGQGDKEKVDLSNLPVDVAVLRQLPREIAEEQCQFYGIDKNILNEISGIAATADTESNPEEIENNRDTAKVDSYYENIDTVDQSFLLALPDNVRQDVLLQLQEAQGRRKATEHNTVFDDQQPCSSRQALERSKEMELRRQKMIENVAEDDTLKNDLPLEEQLTPVISYSKSGMDPKLFWDMSVQYLAVHPKPYNRPALNHCVEIGDVRELIRTGLQVVTDPKPEEVESLEKYFVQLISDGWMEQTQVLLKFLFRQTVQLGDNSKWTPVLHKIIESTQECCRKLYHGELEVE